MRMALILHNLRNDADHQYGYVVERADKILKASLCATDYINYTKWLDDLTDTETMKNKMEQLLDENEQLRNEAYRIEEIFSEITSIIDHK